MTMTAVGVAETSVRLELSVITASAPVLKVRSSVMDHAYRWVSMIAEVAEMFA